MGEKEIPVETFDALLRDLVTWNLVVLVEGDGPNAWALVPRAQQRLADLTRDRGPWPAERTAYLGRRCADCGKREVTWMRHGEYVCDPCWQQRLVSTESDQPADLAPSGRTRWRRRRRAQIA
ncbi:MAG: hypothetical protein ABSD85_01825 [Acidimicrobiales bacterium]|jgi:hypothetical protein